MHLLLFSLITSEIFQLIYRYRYQFVGEVMTDMRSIKEMIQCVTLRIPKGMKNAISISIANMIRGGHRKLARSFNLRYRYIDDLFSTRSLGIML